MTRQEVSALQAGDVVRLRSYNYVGIPGIRNVVTRVIKPASEIVPGGMVEVTAFGRRVFASHYNLSRPTLADLVELAVSEEKERAGIGTGAEVSGD